MQKGATMQTLSQRSLHSLRSWFNALEAFVRKVSSYFQRGVGVLFCVGGLLATIGWLLAAVHTDPLSPTWNPAVWLVMIGVFLLALGMQAMYFQHMLRLGILGQYGLMIFLFGTLILLAGTCAVDFFILPWIFKLISKIPDLSSQLQGMYNTVQQGTNSATSTIVNTGTNVCNTITSNIPFIGGSSSCSSTTTPTVPSETVPTIGSLLTSAGLPSLTTLSTLGLLSMSGVLLVPGCLLMGLVFLVAGVQPRSALLLVIIGSLLNLLGQFVIHVAFLSPLLQALLFISLAWFGISLWLQGKPKAG